MIFDTSKERDDHLQLLSDLGLWPCELYDANGRKAVLDQQGREMQITYFDACTGEVRYYTTDAAGRVIEAQDENGKYLGYVATFTTQLPAPLMIQPMTGNATSRRTLPKT